MFAEHLTIPRGQARGTRRALVLAYDYPPCRAPGAAVRSAKFVRHLPEFGWCTTVVCRDEGLEEDADQAAAILRIPSRISDHFSYQLTALDWAARILNPVRALLRKQQHDLVYFSCPPFWHGLSALHLSREAGLPLVVDFRDAWSLDPFGSGGQIKRLVKRFLCRTLYPLAESRLLRGADEFIANTPSMRREYARLLGWPQTRINLLPNGFDDSDFQETIETPARQRPLFVYCGRFAQVAGRDPSLILHGVRALIDAGIALDLRIVGDDTPQLRDAITRLHLGDFVTTCPSVSHAEAIREIRQADVLVLFQPTGRTGVTPIAGKTFEYLRSGRPILAIVPEGDNADLVRSCAPAFELVTSFDSAQVIRAMKNLCAQLTLDRQPTHPSSDFLQGHDRRHLTAQLAAVFDRAMTCRARSVISSPPADSPP